MPENPLPRFDRAVAAAENVIAAVKPEQLADPTPCSGWSVRELINHCVFGNTMFVSIIAGAPTPDRDADHVGDDPAGAFRRTIGDLRTAFSGEGVLQKMYQTPVGQGPGAQLVGMRTVEMLVHTWDLARATGQPTDFEPEAAEWALETIRPMMPADRTDTPFDAEQPCPPEATAADRLAAFAGRSLA